MSTGAKYVGPNSPAPGNTNARVVARAPAGRSAPMNHPAAATSVTAMPIQKVQLLPHTSPMYTRNRPTAAKPAQPCLSSRIPYGREVTAEKLAAIEAGEEALRELGFAEGRVRHYGEAARVEVPAAEAHRLDAEARAFLERRLAAAGFRRLEIDPEGFRSGKLNRELSPAEREPFERTRPAAPNLPK